MSDTLVVAIVFGVCIFNVVIFAAWAAGLLEVEDRNDLEDVRSGG